MIPPRIILTGDQKNAAMFVKFGSFLLDSLQQNIDRMGLFQLSTYKMLPGGGTIHASVIGNERKIKIFMPIPVTEAVEPVEVEEPIIRGDIFLVFEVGGLKAIVWDIAKNAYAEIPDPDNPSTMLTFPCDWSKVSDLVNTYKVDHVSGSATKKGNPEYEDICYISDISIGAPFRQYGTRKEDYPVYDNPPPNFNYTASNSHECQPGTIDYYFYNNQEPTNSAGHKTWPGPCGNRTDTISLNSAYVGDVLGYVSTGEYYYQISSLFQRDIQARRQYGTPIKGSYVGSQYGYVNTIAGNGEVVCLKVSELHRSNREFSYMPDYILYYSNSCVDTLWAKALLISEANRDLSINVPIGTFPNISQFKYDKTYAVHGWYVDENNGVLTIEEVVNERIGHRAKVKNAFSFEMNGFYKNIMYQVYHYYDIKKTTIFQLDPSSTAFHLVWDEEGPPQYSRRSYFIAGCDYFDDMATNHSPKAQTRNSSLESALSNLFNVSLAGKIADGLGDEDMPLPMLQFLIEVK